MNRRIRHERGNFAFTLIELLVVVAIIAILMAVLLPSLANARKQSQTVVCLANLRAIGQGMQTYVSDQDGFIPPAVYVYSGSTLGQFAQPLAYYDYVKTSPSRIYDPASYAWRNAPGSLFRSSFMCPSGLNEAINWSEKPVSASDPRGARYIGFRYPIQNSAPVGQPWNTYVTNYGANAGTWDPASTTDNNVRNGVYPMTVYTNDPSKPWRKYYSIRHASDLAMIFDGMLNSSDSANYINGRHNDGIYTNVLFADWHAETLRRDRLPQQTGSTNPLWMRSVLVAWPYPNWRMDQID